MIDYTAIVTLIVGLFSGGGVIWIFTLKSEKKKKQAEADGEYQNVYQEMISDLREDRRIMKEERDNLLVEIKELQMSVEIIKADIEKLKKRHAKEQCLRMECKERLFG
ncbi:MAG: hypothetical protein GX962_13420 [Epulopiscium sp.]|nr:hypothetical protein [Candidatus Epulonipiscium sp.]